MNAKKVLKHLRGEPFQPFAVVTSGGERHEIRHPENAKVVEGGVLYVFQPAASDDAEVQSPHIISLLHVTTLDPIREPAA